MFHNKKFVALIPARGGSKGIPYKNLIMLGGKPLIIWSIEQAIKAKYIDEVYVSTEDPLIKEESLKAGANVIDRPNALARDETSTEEVLLHASSLISYDYMVLLQCTSPFRYSYHIDEAIELIVKKQADSLLSGYENDRFLWTRDGHSLNYDFRRRPRRQEKKWEFVENGSIYIFKKEILETQKNRLGGTIAQYLMPKWMSLEIDTYEDLNIARLFMDQFYFRNINNIYLLNKLKKIKAILFDVDGVFTDAKVYLNSHGEEVLSFNKQDSKGIELLKKFGFILAVVSSEKNNKVIQLRMKKLMIEEVYVGVDNKEKVYETFKQKYNLSDEEIAYCGDDINDLVLLKKVGISFCPSNAQKIVKDICHYVSPCNGGNGFIRDVANFFIENLEG